MPILSLLVTVLVYALIAACVLWVLKLTLAAFEVPGNIAMIIYAIVVLLLLISALSLLPVSVFPVRLGGR